MYFLSIHGRANGITPPILATKTTPWQHVPLQVRHAMTCEEKNTRLSVRFPKLGTFKVRKRRFDDCTFGLLIGQDKPIIAALLAMNDDPNRNHDFATGWLAGVMLLQDDTPSRILAMLAARPHQPLVVVGPCVQQGPVATAAVASALRVVDWFAVSWVSQMRYTIISG